MALLYSQVIIISLLYIQHPPVQRAGQCGSGSEWSRMPIQTCTGPKNRYVHGYTEFGMKGHRLHCYIANYNIISLLYLYSSSAPCWSIKGHGNVVNGPACLYKLAQRLMIDMSVGIPSLA